MNDIEDDIEQYDEFPFPASKEEWEEQLDIVWEQGRRYVGWRELFNSAVVLSVGIGIGIALSPLFSQALRPKQDTTIIPLPTPSLTANPIPTPSPVIPTVSPSATPSPTATSTPEKKPSPSPTATATPEPSPPTPTTTPKSNKPRTEKRNGVEVCVFPNGMIIQTSCSNPNL
ncbi:MAG: hypothetical protein ACOYK8_04335 [Alphaproteobacteria bacterium]